VLMAISNSIWFIRSVSGCGSVIAPTNAGCVPTRRCT
jgi:hypothetical protein